MILGESDPAKPRQAGHARRINVQVYEPIESGPRQVASRTFEAVDAKRGRRFPVDVWYPEPPGARRGLLPLVVFSHLSGGNRRSSSFLCTHLASHGYAVAAMDHSEVVAPELQGGRPGETAAQRAERIEGIIASRVPDVRLLLDFLLTGGGEMQLDANRIGLVGHSAGGWTVLATTEVDARVRSVVGITPGGSSNPKPGILPVRLQFTRQHPVPTLILAAEDDVLTPLDGIQEIFEKTPPPKAMFVLRRADHEHFVDDVESIHEGLRTATLTGDSAWIPAAMRPYSELASADEAHGFTRALTLAHFDASLREDPAARRFLDNAQAALEARGVHGFRYPASR